MRIDLDEGFYITTDQNDIALVEVHGKTEYKHYYRSIEGAVERFLEEVHKRKAKDFEGKINKYYTLIKESNADAVKKIVKKGLNNDRGTMD